MPRCNSRIAVAASLLTLATGAWAGTLQVPTDFPTIQAAVDAAQAGDEILILPGVYEEAVEVTGKTSLTIRGQGKAILQPGSALIGIHVTNSVGVSILDLTIDRALNGILAFDMTDLLVKDCTLSHTEDFGIHFVNSSGGFHVQHCRILDAFGVGIAENSDATALPLIEDCLIESHKAAILVGDAVQATIVNNVLRSGVLDFSSMEEAGVFLTHCSGTQSGSLLVSGNRCEGGRGILLDTCTGVTVSANDIVESIAEGVRLEDSSGCVVIDNRITRGRSFGILLSSGSDDCIVSGNVVKRVGSTGIHLAPNGVLCNGNSIIRPGGDGLVIDGDSGNYADNTISGADRLGVFLFGAQLNTLSGFVVKGSGQFDLFLFGSSNNTIADDNAFGTTGSP